LKRGKGGWGKKRLWDGRERGAREGSVSLVLMGIVQGSVSSLIIVVQIALRLDKQLGHPFVPAQVSRI